MYGIFIEWYYIDAALGKITEKLVKILWNLCMFHLRDEYPCFSSMNFFLAACTFFGYSHYSMKINLDYHIVFPTNIFQNFNLIINNFISFIYFFIFIFLNYRSKHQKPDNYFVPVYKGTLKLLYQENVELLKQLMARTNKNTLARHQQWPWSYSAF